MRGIIGQVSRKRSVFASGSKSGLRRSSNTEFTIRTFINRPSARAAIGHLVFDVPPAIEDRDAGARREGLRQCHRLGRATLAGPLALGLLIRRRTASRSCHDARRVGVRIARWDGRILYAVGQAFQPDVRLDSLTYSACDPFRGCTATCSTPRSTSLRCSCRKR